MMTYDNMMYGYDDVYDNMMYGYENENIRMISIPKEVNN